MMTTSDPQETLRQALFELVTLVRGECPSLLNEDSGGDAALSMRIDAALAALPSGPTCGVCGKPATCKSLEPPEVSGDGDSFACSTCCHHNGKGPYGRCAALPSGSTPEHFSVDEIRGGENNDGPVESTDIFLRRGEMSLLINVPASASGVTYSFHSATGDKTCGVIAVAPPASLPTAEQVKARGDKAVEEALDWFYE